MLSRVKYSDFAVIMKRINSRLYGSKCKLLSSTRRVDLAQSVVAAMPTGSLQNPWIPRCIFDKIDATD